MKRNLFLLIAGLVVVAACKQSDNRVQAFVDTTKTATATTATAADDARADREDNTTDILLQRTPKGMPDKVLRRTAYTTSYNHETRCPNWVAWTLTRDHTYGSQQRSNERFEEDTDVKTPRATFQDFYSSRYDRGHMCPAGDNKWSEDAMAQSFLLTNICPQNHGMNKNAWNDLEIQCRSWAREYGAVDIVCGPIFRGVSYENGKMKPSPSQRFIGRNKVWVPDAFFKVILCRNRSPKALGFIYENRGGQQTLADCVCSVDEIERLTGIDFFYLLADDVENRVEKEAKLSQWPKR